MSEAYERMVKLSSDIQLMNDTQALLSWDQEVLMPTKGGAYRAKQMSWLSGEAHRRFTDPVVGELISEIENEDLDEFKRANAREWRHQYDRATALPVELVEKFASAQSVGKSLWAEARKKSDFSMFSEALSELVELNREQAELWGYEECSYDALLDRFERGARASNLEKVLGNLKRDLVPLVEEALSLEPFDQSLVKGDCPVEKQAAFNLEIAGDIGFDFEAGRIDTAVHPFCSGMAPFDTRLTTRYDPNDFRSSLYGVLHETGHGLYEQGLKADWHGQPVGSSVSLGVHESQSRLWENHVGRSPEFWKKWLGRASDYFPHLKGLTPEQMTRAVNQAEMSFIRVEADEVTYDLHVLLRFEIEKAIFDGEIEVADIPGEWNKRFEEMFGMTVPDDSNGCLQDIHWSMGMFGYFPTYSLGNLNASHLYEAALASDATISAESARGNYQPLLKWMRKNIHEKGSLHLPNQLIEVAAGKAVTAEAHLKHLRRRYLD